MISDKASTGMPGLRRKARIESVFLGDYDEIPKAENTL